MRNVMYESKIGTVSPIMAVAVADGGIARVILAEVKESVPFMSEKKQAYFKGLREKSIKDNWRMPY